MHRIGRPPLIVCVIWGLLLLMVLVFILALVFGFLGLIYFAVFQGGPYVPTVPHI